MINLLCDRALLAGYAEYASWIRPELITRAAESLDLGPSRAAWWRRVRRHAGAALAGATAAVVLGATAAGLAYQQGWAGAHGAPLPVPPRPVVAPALSSLSAPAALDIVVPSSVPVSQPPE